MSKIRVPDEFETRIIRENGIDPAKVGVEHTDQDSIRLLNYKTRDNIIIQKGDRKWL